MGMITDAPRRVLDKWGQDNNVLYVGAGCEYTTIQEAVTAATAAGMDADTPYRFMIHGTHTVTSTLALAPGAHLVGADGGAGITGSGVVALSGLVDVRLENLTLTAADGLNLMEGDEITNCSIAGCRLLGDLYLVGAMAGDVVNFSVTNCELRASNCFELFGAVQHMTFAHNTVRINQQDTDMCLSLFDIAANAASHKNIVEYNAVYIEKKSGTGDTHLPYCLTMAGWGNSICHNTFRLVHHSTTGQGPNTQAGLINIIGPAALTGLTDEDDLLPNVISHNTVQMDVFDTTGPVGYAAVSLENDSADTAAADIIVADNQFNTNDANITRNPLSIVQAAYAGATPTVTVFPGGCGGWTDGSVTLTNALLSLRTAKRHLGIYLPSLAAGSEAYVFAPDGTTAIAHRFGEWVRVTGLRLHGYTDGDDDTKDLAATLYNKGGATGLAPAITSDGIGAVYASAIDTSTSDFDATDDCYIYLLAEAEGNNWTHICMALEYQGLV